MIGPLAVGESNAAADDGLFHRTNSLYYRFLNCGFKLGVSGGSAIGVMALPTGYNRVYAHVEGKMTADKLWAAIDKGRTFATTGPMLTLTANDKSIGGTVLITSDQTQVVSIRTTVRSTEQLESLQIIHDGHVVTSQELLNATPDPIMESELTFTLKPQRSGWIASRALFRAPDGLLRQAHTSPIYVSIDGKPAASSNAAQYLLRWVDKLATIANSHPGRFPDVQAQQTVLAIYAEARARYEQIIETAQQNWGD